MDPFERLPWFVLRRVLSDLPDLQSLYRIRCGSPAVASFLREDGGSFTTIVEAIISNDGDGSGLIPQNQFRTRNIVLWWWWVSSKNSDVEPKPGDNPVPQSSEDVLRFSLGEIHTVGPISRRLDAIYGHAPLPLSTPPIVLFRLLAMSSRIRQIVHACFHDLIACCMSLKPEYMANSRFKFRNRGYKPITDRSARPPGLPHLPVDIGPPSWLEEQMIMGALLVIILSIELRNTLLSRDDLGVGEKASRFAYDNPGTDLWEDAENRFPSSDEHEQFRTVLLWLKKKAEGFASIRSWVISSPIPGSFISCCPNLTIPRLPGFDEYRETNPCRTVGCTAMQRCRVFSMSPLRCMDNSLFRPFGLAIWEAEDLRRWDFFRRAKLHKPPIIKYISPGQAF